MTVPESPAWREIHAYLDSTGVPHRLTSSVRNGTGTSWHNTGRACDFAGVKAGRDTPELAAIFEAFVPVEHLLFELIYSGASYSVKRGRRVNRYAVSGHWDHVHVALAEGVYLPRPTVPDEPTEEVDDMPLPVIKSDQSDEQFIITAAGTRIQIRSQADRQALEKAGIIEAGFGVVSVEQLVSFPLAH